MKILHLDSVGSTNSEAFDQLKYHSPVSVIASRQTAGRGRGQNIWSSPMGNLHVSVGDMLVASQLPGLSVRVAVHLTRFLNPFLNDGNLQIKWPNDLMMGDHKAGGILVESRIKGREAATVVGIGLNITDAPLDTAIAIGDQLNMPIERLQKEVISTVHTAMHDPLQDQLLTDLHHMSWLVANDRIQFEESGQSITGSFEGYGFDLTLHISVNGRSRSVSASMIQRVRKERT